MSFVAASAIMGGGSLLGGLFGASGAKKAAKAQLQAAREAMALQKELYYDQINRQEPFRQAGLTTQNELLRQLGLSGDAGTAGYGSLMRDFGMDQFQADPGYAFRLSEGMKAMDRAAAARGGLISGAALKAGQRYGQEMGSQEYQNAFNRYQTERAQRYNMLTGQQAVGQEATGAQGAAAQGYGAAGSELLTGMGNARASGYMGTANALSGALQGVGSAFMQGAMLKNMFPGGGGAGAGTYAHNYTGPRYTNVG